MVSLAGLLACPSSVFALGFAVPDQDAFATARGNAFVATADDPAAVFYNPAGISQLDGFHFSSGIYGLDYGSSYSGPLGHFDSKQELSVLPQIFATWKVPAYNLTFGLGAYCPYGLREEWPAAVPLIASGFLAGGETGEIDYYRLNPVVSYQILPTLSLAAGATLDYSEGYFKEYPGFVNEFRGRDTAAGYNVGILWHPWAKHSFGITYRSSTDMNYAGHATALAAPSATIPSQANVHFPRTAAFGYSYRPTTNWNFEVDANWTDWTDLRTVNVNPQAPFGDKLNFNWSPSWMLDVGATRYLDNGWRVSGGFMYSEDTVPNSTFNALVPDSDRYLFSIGVGKKFDRWSADLAYQLGWGPSRTVTADNNPAFDGKYDFLSHAISINVGYHF